MLIGPFLCQPRSLITAARGARSSEKKHGRVTRRLEPGVRPFTLTNLVQFMACVWKLNNGKSSYYIGQFTNAEGRRTTKSSRTIAEGGQLPEPLW